MRIVHVINYFNTNAHYQENYMVREHVRAGHDTYVVTSDRNFPHPDYQNTAQQLYGDRRIGTGVSVHEGVTIVRLRTVLEVRCRSWLGGLERRIRKIQPDVVICHGILDVSTIRLLLMQASFRLVVDEHQVSQQVDRSRIGRLVYWLFRAILTPRLLRRAEKLIAISEACIETMTQHLGIPPERVRVIPLGADEEKFRFDPDARRRFRAEHGIAEDTVVITHTGKLYEEKKPHLVIEAANALEARGRVHLLFVGRPTQEYEEKFAAALAASSVPHTYIPFVSQQVLAEVFSASDVAVWPAGPTISTLEAASCGVAIVCADNLGERLKYNNGIGIPYGSREALQEALTRLVGNDDLRRTMGDNGRAYVENELSWRALTPKFLE